MGCYYAVAGVIALVDKPGLDDAIDELCDADDRIDTTLDVEDHGKILRINVSDGMSYSSAESIESAIHKFAAKWASKPATLETECDGERGEMFVGPEGFDEVAAEIANIDRKIAALQAERALLATPTAPLMWQPTEEWCVKQGIPSFAVWSSKENGMRDQPCIPEGEWCAYKPDDIEEPTFMDRDPA